MSRQHPEQFQPLIKPDSRMKKVTNQEKDEQLIMQPNQEYDNCPIKKAVNLNPTINQFSKGISELSDQQLESVVGGLARHELTDDQLESIVGVRRASIVHVIGFEN